MAMTPTQALSEALQLYFNLMYDCDVSNLERVFAATAQLHGFREGQMQCWPAAQYCYHKIDDNWLVTSKAYQRES